MKGKRKIRKFERKMMKFNEIFHIVISESKLGTFLKYGKKSKKFMKPLNILRTFKHKTNYIFIISCRIFSGLILNLLCVSIQFKKKNG